MGVLWVLSGYYATLRGTQHMNGIPVSETRSMSTTCSITSSEMKKPRQVLCSTSDCVHNLFSVCEATSRVLCPVVGLPTEEKQSIYWSNSAGGTPKKVRGLKHMAYEEALRELSLFSLNEENTKSRSYSVHGYLEEGVEKLEPVSSQR